MAGRDVTRTIEAVWRIESARPIAAIARLLREVALAEDLADQSAALKPDVPVWYPRRGPSAGGGAPPYAKCL